jgi:multiple sugar transport system permease protein
VTILHRTDKKTGMVHAPQEAKPRGARSAEAGDRAVPKHERTQRKGFGWLLVLPTIMVLVAIGLFPLLYAINFSVRDADFTFGPPFDFVGLDNFRFALDNPLLWQSLRRTVIFVVFAVGIQMVLGTAIALLLNRRLPAQFLIRGLLILPLAVAPLAAGIIWRLMLNVDFGVVNPLMQAIGLPTRTWLGDPATALASIIVYDIWQWTPFVIFVVLAALQALPREPFEAAEVYGASSWRIFRTLTLPMISPALLLVLLLRLIDAFRLFDPIFALTHGGPGLSTELASWFLYRVAFQRFFIGDASAIAILFLYLTIVLTALLIRFWVKVSKEEL